MSYDISLLDPIAKEVIMFDHPHQMSGGSFCAGGTREAWLNITWNYSRWYYKDGVFPNNGEEKEGIRSIYGMSGTESIPILENAIKILESMEEDLTEEEIKKFKDSGAGGYWTPTRANAIKPLYQLLAMARMRPDGIWYGD